MFYLRGKFVNYRLVFVFEIFFISIINVSEQQSFPIVGLKVVEESEVITTARALKANDHTLAHICIYIYECTLPPPSTYSFPHTHTRVYTW